MRARHIGWKHLVAAGAALTAGVAFADTAAAQSLDDYASFGIDEANGALVLYSFDASNSATYTDLGALQQDGAALTGIRGSTHVPGHTDMFYAFWTDAEGQTHLVHVIPSADVPADLVGSMRAIEGGTVTGAASFRTADGQSTRSFILQQESYIPTYDISGRININPNNAPNMRFEFQRVTDAGQTLVDIDRANLNDREWRDANSYVDADGNLIVFDDTTGDGEAYDYETHTTMIQVRPKGNHNQDQIQIVSDTGQEFELHNANTYNLNGKLSVRLYNDHVNDQGMAMGKWWLELEGQAQFEQSEVGTVNRIAELKASDLEPEVVEAAVLSDHLLGSLGVDSEQLVGLGGRLDANDQIELFVAAGNDVYRVQPALTTTGEFDADNPIVEHVLSLGSEHELRSLDFAGGHLVGLDSYNGGQFMVLDVDNTDATPTAVGKPGGHALGTITFMPDAVAEDMLLPNYD